MHPSLSLVTQDLTVEQFVERFERPRLPVIITGLPDTWPSAASSSLSLGDQDGCGGACDGGRCRDGSGCGGRSSQSAAPWTVENLLQRFGEHRFKVCQAL